MNPSIRTRSFHHIINKDSAVSPVIGIMLMLIITVVLAAVISGYSGGIAKVQTKPPTLVFDARLVNNVTETEESFLDITIISISDGIPTRDLKFQTEWMNESQKIQRNSLSFGTGIYPLGFKAGSSISQHFGDFTLLAGTHLYANGTEYEHKVGMKEVLGSDWKNMEEGTPVRLQFIHVPSGAIIADKEITSEEIS